MIRERVSKLAVEFEEAIFLSCTNHSQVTVLSDDCGLTEGNSCTDVDKKERFQILE
jgi:hypothetical protein